MVYNYSFEIIITNSAKLTEYKSLSDTELLQKVSNSDSKALEMLYERYSPLLFTLIKKIVQKPEAAEHLLTEVFVIIWRKVNHFDFHSGNAYTWIVTLTRNKAIDYLQRQRTNVEPEEYNDSYEDQYIVPKLAAGADALDLNTAFSIRPNIENALSKLTDAQKYVIHLAYYEGYTQKGIAEKLNIPLQTVKTKVKFALNNFKDNLIKESE